MTRRRGLLVTLKEPVDTETDDPAWISAEIRIYYPHDADQDLIWSLLRSITTRARRDLEVQLLERDEETDEPRSEEASGDSQPDQSDAGQSGSGQRPG